MNSFYTLLIFLVTLNIYAQDTKHPNIIWITCEDTSPYIASFGDKVVKTPNIDALAKDGVKYTSTYTIAGVCSPSRAGLITGMHPISIGAQHMRTKSRYEGVPYYDAVLPANVKAFPEYLRASGYYTSNNSKEDYQFEEPVTVWDESSPAGSYTNNKDAKPFFSVYNFFITHESQVMKYPENLTVSTEQARADLPSFYMDTPTSRKDVANMLTHIETMDKQVGDLIEQLKRDGVYENSYIFFFSDHGGNLPWMKRELLERGTHIPFIIKHPKSEYKGSTITNLISSIDFAPTVLSLAGIEPPQYLHGKAFLGKYASKEQNQYVYAARDRMDQHYERVRAVRDTHFRYIYNYNPQLPKYQDILYRKGIPVMKEILQMKEEGKITNQYLLDWFKAPKGVEELYNVSEDPEELHNLINDPKYTLKLNELRVAYNNWISRVGDLSYMEEKDMVENYMWKGKKEVPKTEALKMIQTKEGLLLLAPTEGTSIGYRIIKKGEVETLEKHTIQTWDASVLLGKDKNGTVIDAPLSWNVYQGEILKLKKGDNLLINAMRIGYEPYTTTYIQK